MSNRTEHVRFIHRFDEDELAELSTTLSNTLTEYNETEEEKKQVASRYNTELKELRKTMNLTNRKIRDGYEERAGECSVTRDVRNHEVLYHLLETGEPISGHGVSDALTRVFRVQMGERKHDILTNART